LVGEETTAATTYLSITSRVLDRPTSVAVKGHSASGKSFTVDTVTKFFPSSALLVMTGMSERALVYMKEDYRYRTIVLYEADALRETTKDNLTSYFVRSLLSEGRIEYPVTIRDKGRQLDHEDDREGRPDQHRVHHHEGPGSRRERDPPAIAHNRRQPGSDPPGVHAAGRR
jgi:hypothetical protein